MVKGADTPTFTEINKAPSFIVLCPDSSRRKGSTVLKSLVIAARDQIQSSGLVFQTPQDPPTSLEPGSFRGAPDAAGRFRHRPLPPRSSLWMGLVRLCLSRPCWSFKAPATPLIPPWPPPFQFSVLRRGPRDRNSFLLVLEPRLTLYYRRQCMAN